MRALALVFLAACWHSSEPAAPAAKPAQPATPQSYDDALVQLTAFRERACECHTSICASAINKDFDAYALQVAALGKRIEQIDAQLSEKVIRTIGGYQSCIDGATSYQAVVDRMTKMRTDACACKDTECVMGVDAQFSEYDEKVFAVLRANNYDGTDEQRAHVDADTHQMVMCMATVLTAAEQK